VTYEHKLVYVSSVDEYLEDGWEPTPNTVPVNKTNPLPPYAIQQYVWLRRAVT
jgi:hypothetical protein